MTPSFDAESLTVVLVHALPHSGASWLSLVLGAHEGVFALGPLDLARLPTASQLVCGVHGDACSLWSRVRAEWREDEHPLAQIARAVGARVLVISTQHMPESTPLLDEGAIRVRRIMLARDGRSIAASRAAMLDRPDIEALCRDWLAPQMARFDWGSEVPDTLCVRFEDVVADPGGQLPGIASHVGVVGNQSALRFWEQDLHPLGAHPAMLAMIRRHQHLSAPEMRDRAFYEEQTVQLLTDPQHRFPAHRRQKQLSERDLLAFDAACGRFNEGMGYDRDRFTSDQWRALAGESGTRAGRVGTSEDAVRPDSARAPRPSLATLVVALLSAGLAALAFLKAAGAF